MDYSFIAKGYNELYGEEQLKKLDLVKKHLAVKKTHLLLDLGCGIGLSTNFFGCRGIGIDKSFNMLQQGKGNLVCALAEHLPFKDRCFDAIISITAIHNFDNVEQAIGEIKRVAKNNVKIAISVLKRSEKFKNIKRLLDKNFKFKKIEEEKDMIFLVV